MLPFRRPPAAAVAVTLVLVTTTLVTTTLFTTVTGAAGVAAALQAPVPGLGSKPAPAPTTTVPLTTTTRLPPPTTPNHGPGPNPPGPPQSTSTTLTPPPTAPPPPPYVVNALVRAVQNQLAQLDAITGYDQDKGIVTVNQANAATADSDADLATRAETDASALVSSAQAALADRERRLAALGVALYVRSDVGQSSARLTDSGSATDLVNRGVVLGILITHGRQEVTRAKRQLQDDLAILRAARERAGSARAFQARAHLTLDKSAGLLADAKLAAAGRSVKPTTGTPLPTIMGPSALSAGELAGWFATTGYQANTTVPMSTLASFYVSSAKAAGLRGDIAFAQSIVETGYFSFPSGGQLLGGDNNFAGIGACDTCAHGWRFPNAQTGVAAQVQLLQAYAATKRIPTPLVGRVSVAGCCPTWLSLSGVWATARNYGYAILSIYQEMLNWAIPQRLAAAGL
ncbi:MAG: glucosaminidase domain-containing protein [Actinomycetota bacterium]|nr:glucosaminidase domain-containing protein [Actinomycetota bacterium]MDQ6947911.1 glucosaminidase domain-containing protein [Actinomycetota bacterium]